MSRPKRILRKRFIIFCEGDTEYNYIDHMRKNQGVELSLKLFPVDIMSFSYKTKALRFGTEMLFLFDIISVYRIRHPAPVRAIRFPCSLPELPKKYEKTRCLSLRHASASRSEGSQ